MSSNKVDVGTPPAGNQIWESRAVCFHGFRDLPSERGEIVRSPKFKCLGHNWIIDLYPGGNAHAPEGMVAIFLYLNGKSSDSTCIDYYFAVRNSAGKEIVCTNPDPARKFDSENQGIGFDKFTQRSTLIDALVEGTLIIEIYMRKSGRLSTLDQNLFIPKNPIHKNILAMFMEEESADMIFKVGGGRRGGRSSKKAKTATSTFHAHRFIVQNIASTFADMCQANGGETVTIPITDVKAAVFRLMLYYGYGGEISDKELKANAKELIDAAYKYGMTSLKLRAEACYVKSTTLDLDNILENLLYAHAKNCALLKEAAMDFVVRNGNDIMDEVSLDEVPGSMMKDLLAAMARGKQEDGAIEDTYHSMRVGSLRRMLNKKGLDIDGSREAMIALLKEHC